MKWVKYAKKSIDPTDPYPEMNGQPCLLPGGEYNSQKNAPQPIKQAEPKKAAPFTRPAPPPFHSPMNPVLKMPEVPYVPKRFRGNPTPGRLWTAQELADKKTLEDALKKQKEK